MRYKVWEMSTSQTHKLAVRSSKTVHALKTRLQVKTGIPIERMRITFDNRTLEDGHKLSECGIWSYRIHSFRTQSRRLWTIPVLILSQTGLTFTVKTEMGTEHEVHMSSSDLVQRLELKLQEITDCPTNQQKLMFNGTRLEHNRPLSAYGIQQASVVHMMIHKHNNVTVVVKTVTGKSFYIDLDLCDTVENLKVKIQDQEGIPVDQMRLIFAGEQLEDKRTVSDCGIKHLTIVHLMLRLCGGNDVNETVKMDFPVSVKTATGQRHEVDVRPSDTVQALKIQLQDQTRVPTEHMCITFEEKILEDGHKLSECGIQPKSVLYLWIRPRETGLTFTVKTEMGTEHKVHMDSLDPVKMLKLILQEMIQCPINQQELIFNHRLLEDDRSLSEYGIQKASVVHMMILDNDIVVIVKKLTGKKMYIDLDVCDTVENLRAKTAVKEGLPVNQIRLMFAGRQLEDERTVSDYRIGHLSIVHVILRLRGGGGYEGMEEEEGQEEGKDEDEEEDGEEDEEEDEDIYEELGEDDDDVGENRGRRMSMEELADFNHEKPWSCQIC